MNKHLPALRPVYKSFSDGNDNMNTLVIWDLDGTLTESKPWIIASYKYAAEAAGLPVPSDEVLSHMMCGGILGHVYEIFGKTGPEADRIAGYYREHYARTGLYNVELFEGVRELIEELNSRGVAQAIATMKVKEVAEKVMERLDLSKFMVAVEGDTTDSKVTKAQMIKNCILTGTYDRVIMIGDCPSDRKAAIEADVEFIAVVYGYGYTAERCHKEGIPCAETVSDILSMICF